ncbi:hypothetical protein ACTHS9_06425 [Bacillus mycoides]|uniref:hypothetical protein n=1 Tax=Bacillus mycoides TaxID=1405 RepID=UPI003F7C3D27
MKDVKIIHEGIFTHVAVDENIIASYNSESAKEITEHLLMMLVDAEVLNLGIED